MPDPPKNKDIPNLYKAIGSAISNWSRIEIQMHQLFSISLSLTVMQPGGGFSIGSQTAHTVLDSIDGFRPKLLMIDAALAEALRDLDDEATAILNDWAVERKKVNSLHWNRNALAHWTVARLLNQDGSTQKVVLQPPVYSSDEHQGVTETDVEGWENAFIEAQDRLVTLVARLASHQGLQRRFLEQVASQVACIAPYDPTLLEFLKHDLSERLRPFGLDA